MSHFTVLVIGENPEEQLAPFDENLEVARYQKYTKQQLIDEGRAEIESYKNGTYAEFLSDPVKYKETHGKHAEHIKYLENEFPKKLNWTDEEIYQDQIKWYEPEQIGEHGEVYSERNPQSKWDWYLLGGRWTGMFKKIERHAVQVDGHGQPIRPTRFKTGEPGLMTEPAEDGTCDQALKRDIANLNEIQTFAVIKDGKWYECGEKEGDQWGSEFKKLLDGLPDDTLLSIYDCHI